MEIRLQSGTLWSGIGHAGVILWVLLGDWLFAPDPVEPIVATQVSMMTEAEFQALQSAAPSGPAAPPEQPTEITAPEPVQPDTPPPEPAVEPPPTPKPEPLPEPEVQPEPQPAPEPQPEEVVVAPEEQLMPSLSDTLRPKPKPADVVAPAPVDVTEDVPQSEAPTEATSDEPVPDPQVVEEPKQETAPQETGDVLRTEATEEQTESLGMTASIRPKSRPERPETPVEEPPAEEVQTAAAEPAPEPPTDATADPAADAIAAALAEASAEDTSAEAGTGGAGEGPKGPPLNAGEIGDIRSAIGNKWNLGSVSTETMHTVVVVRVEFSAEGKPVDISLIESDGPSQAAIDTAFSAARRAIQRAYTEGGIPLPPDKYDTWKVVEFVFDANGMRFR